MAVKDTEHKVFAIKAIGGSIMFPVYSTKELAEADRRALPDSYTDYEHYEVIEIPMITNNENLLWVNTWKNLNTDSKSSERKEIV